MKHYILISVLLFVQLFAGAQQKLSQNVVVITMDGLRWQEVFGGADSLLSFDTNASYSTRYVQQKFWAATPEERRKKLMPFFWNVLAKDGLLVGNRQHGSFFHNANPYWFSYPGYNEIFTGHPDTAVNSNNKIPNKNITVLEYLASMPEFKGRAAVFGSWDVFASIFNEGRSGLLVNDGFRNLPAEGLTEKQQWLNAWQHQLPDLFHGGERLDAATFPIAFEYMKEKKPRLLFIGLGDTDEFAHAGIYDMYLDAARKSDAWIQQIWDYIQSTEEYKDKTTLIITTDHGRGLAAGGNWRHHGAKIAESGEMWIAAIGPSIPAVGESRKKQKSYQGQIAASIARMLGKEFKTANQPVMQAIDWSLY